jgi:hypothetical protein
MKFALVVIIILLFALAWSPNMSKASGGLSPEGGMRNYTMKQTELSDTNVTYNEYDVDIYDYSGIPEKKVWSIGHWSK